MTADIRRVSETFYVAPQIRLSDVSMYKEDGFDLIISNRPDGEEPGQPTATEVAAAAEAAGLAFLHLPVGSQGLTHEDLSSFSQAIKDSYKVLAFCKSGMRSLMIRAMALAASGRPADELIEEAAVAGYNIAGQRNLLISLAPNR